MNSIDHQRRGPWSHREDALLMRLVATQGALNWVRIAQQLGTRTPKQCRERYHQNLKPNLNHEPISPEEGALIEQMVREVGKRWAEIARRLNNRSDNAVKNWWNGNQNRRKRMDRRKTAIPMQGPMHSQSHFHSQPPYAHLNQHYDDRTEMAPMDVGRLNTTIPRSLTLASQELSGRHLPPPILAPGAYYDRNYGVETPLASPSMPDSASDSNSHYATSPGQYTMQSPIARLPPLRHNNQGYQPQPQPPSRPLSSAYESTKLPPIHAMNFSQSKPGYECSYPIGSMYPAPPAEYPSPMLTAPNSPASYSGEQQRPAPEKDSRISVANLLG